MRNNGKKEGYIYCLREHDLDGMPLDVAKIGKTTRTIEARIMELQTGNYRKWVMVFCLEAGSSQYESDIHTALTHMGAHIAGEHFDWNNEGVRLMVGHHKSKAGAPHILRLLLNHSKNYKYDPGKDFKLEYTHTTKDPRMGVDIVVNNLWKRCEGCHRTLPVITAHWDSFFFVDNGSSRDLFYLRCQPRCNDCKFTSEHGQDRQTVALF